MTKWWGGRACQGLSGLLAGLAIVCPFNAHAAFVVPSALSGRVTYGYNYFTAGGAEAESTSLSVGGSSSLYFWQPWFITGSVGFDVGLARSAASDTPPSNSRAWGGGLGLQFFPYSRFPLSVNYDVTDSRLASSQGAEDYAYRLRSTRITVSQFYSGRQGVTVDTQWSSMESESDDTTSRSELLSLNSQWRRSQHLFMFTGSRAESSDTRSSRKPVTTLLSLTNDYRPANEFSVNTRVSAVNSIVSGAGDSNQAAVNQLTSVFSWRPEYRPFSVGGGVVLSTSEASSALASTQTDTLATSLSMNYTISRRARAAAALSLSANDSDGQQTTQSSETLSLSYSGDSVPLGAWNYTWSTGGSAANSNTESEGVAVDQQTLAGSFSHGVSRFAMVGSSSFRLSFNQGLGAFVASEQDVPGYSLSNGINTGWTGRAAGGVTDLNVSLSDSRSFGDAETDSQFFTVQVLRNQAINRLSSLDANVNFQATRQSGTSRGGDISKFLSAGLNYNHARAFGINPLRYASSMTYSRNLSEGQSDYDTLDWYNRFDYFVGQLTLALDIRLSRGASDDVTGNLGFRATRQF